MIRCAGVQGLERGIQKDSVNEGQGEKAGWSGTSQLGSDIVTWIDNCELGLLQHKVLKRPGVIESKDTGDQKWK